MPNTKETGAREREIEMEKAKQVEREWVWMRKRKIERVRERNSVKERVSVQKKNIEIMMTGALFIAYMRVKAEKKLQIYRQCTYMNWIGNCVLIYALFCSEKRRRDGDETNKRKKIWIFTYTQKKTTRKKREYDWNKSGWAGARLLPPHSKYETPKCEIPKIDQC